MVLNFVFLLLQKGTAISRSCNSWWVLVASMVGIISLIMLWDCQGRKEPWWEQDTEKWLALGTWYLGLRILLWAPSDFWWNWNWRAGVLVSTQPLWPSQAAYFLDSAFLTWQTAKEAICPPSCLPGCCEETLCLLKHLGLQVMVCDRSLHLGHV